MDDLERLHREHVAHLSAAAGTILAETGWDGVVLHSGTPKLRSVFDDQSWPLRPTPHFAHWLPLLREDSALVVRAGRAPALYLNERVDFWESRPAHEREHFWGAFEVVPVRDPDRLELPAGKLAFIGEDTARGGRWGIPESRWNPRMLLERLDALRTLKTPYELHCLVEANRRAARGHEAVVRAFAEGGHAELDLHLLYLQVTRQDDAETPYKNIVAVGGHAAVLHHVQYGKSPATGARSLLLDAGAAYLGYGSDITRTVVVGQDAEAELFRALCQGLERMQQELCRRIAAGQPYESLHDASHELLAPLLREVGVVRDVSDEEVVRGGVTRLLYPHGLGHSLGIQTHDVGCALTPPRGDNPFLRNTSRIAVGQTFTIEPGCYFIPAKLEELRGSPIGARVDWRVVDTLRPFGGIRIEDDVLVTAEGHRNLTRAVLEVTPSTLT